MRAVLQAMIALFAAHVLATLLIRIQTWISEYAREAEIQ